MRLTPADRLDWKQGLALFAFAAILVTLYVLTAGHGFPLDDSWIHQVYARNLAVTGQWAFVPGQSSGGSTSPLYTVLLALGYFLGAPYALWTHLLGVFALASTGIVAILLLRRLLPQSRGAGPIAALAVVCSWHLIWAAASGMETMLFSMWTLVLLWLCWREFDAGRSMSAQHVMLRGAVFGIAAALMVMTRPEGALLAGLCGLTILALRPGEMRGSLLWSGGAVLSFIVGIVPYLVLNLHLAGGLLPNTSAAKQAQHEPLLALSYPRRFLNLLIPALAGGQILLLPGVVYYGIVRIRDRSRHVWFALLPLVWILALVMLYAARLPAAYQHGRYVMPVLPALIIIGSAGTFELLTAARHTMIARVLTRALALAAVVTFGYFGLILGPDVYRQDVAIIEQEMVDPAHWIADNIPADDLLAVHDIGAVGYFSPRPILDIAGLVTPEIVPLIGDDDGLWAFMEAQDTQYLMAFPDQVPGQNPDDPRLCPVYRSPGTASTEAGGPKMTIYRLAWNGLCLS